MDLRENVVSADPEAWTHVEDERVPAPEEVPEDDIGAGVHDDGDGDSDVDEGGEV